MVLTVLGIIMAIVILAGAILGILLALGFITATTIGLIAVTLVKLFVIGIPVGLGIILAIILF